MKGCFDSIGRRVQQSFKVKNPFLVDYTRLLNSRALKRLQRKTQVISSPMNPHIRTRRTHTDEVIAISNALALNLGLNTSLCMAIGLGHDIGHTPFGHVAERVISRKVGKKFRHSGFGVILAQEIENINLCYETLEGILLHSRGGRELIPGNTTHAEYWVVMMADKIAYTFSDVEDVVNYGFLDKEPKIVKPFGETRDERARTLVDAIIKHCYDKPPETFIETDLYKRFREVRQYMYDNVYLQLDEKEGRQHQEEIIEKIFDYFKAQPIFRGIDPIVAISVLTDLEAESIYTLLEESRNPLGEIRNYGFMERLDELRDVNPHKADLSWRERAKPDIYL